MHIDVLFSIFTELSLNRLAHPLDTMVHMPCGLLRAHRLAACSPCSQRGMSPTVLCNCLGMLCVPHIIMLVRLAASGWCWPALWGFLQHSVCSIPYVPQPHKRLVRTCLLARGDASQHMPWSVLCPAGVGNTSSLCLTVRLAPCAAQKVAMQKVRHRACMPLFLHGTCMHVVT